MKTKPQPFAQSNDLFGQFIEVFNPCKKRVMTVLIFVAVYLLYSFSIPYAIQAASMTADFDPANMSTIYWACDGKILRADLDGDPDNDGLNEEVLLTTDVFGDIVLSGDKMMWFNNSRKAVQRANIDGSGVEDLFTSENSLHLRAIDSGEGKLYWTTSNTLQRANLDGSGVEDVFTFGGGFGDGGFYDDFGDLALDINDEKVYWIMKKSGNPILVKKADFFGTQEEELFSEAFVFPTYPIIKVDTVRKKIYWAYTFEDEYFDFNTASRIHSANLDGTEVKDLNPLVLDQFRGRLIRYPTGEVTSEEIAVYWPAIYNFSGKYWCKRFTIGNTLPLFQFTSASSVTPDESGTSAHRLVIQLHLAAGGILAQDMTVEVMDAGTGTASPGDDYTVIPTQIITFPAGSTDGDVQNIDVAILPDDLEEGEETIHLALGNIQAPEIVGPISAHEVTIADDDQPVTLEFAAAASKTNDESQTSHTLLLTLSRPGGGSLEEAITVDIVDTETGTASANSDYTSNSPTTVMFPAGFTIGDSLALDVPILDDDAVEEDETFQFQLVNLQGPGILGNQSTHKVTITDDDIVVVEGKIYWTDGVEIRRANLNGTQVETVLTTTSNPRSIELDLIRGKMYWMTEEGRVWRANLDGTEIEDIMIEAPGYYLSSSFALDTAGNKLYTLENLVDFYALVTKWDLETGGIDEKSQVYSDGIRDMIFNPVTDQVVLSNDGSPFLYLPWANQLAVDSMNGQLYFTDGYDEIMRADADGKNIEILISGLSSSEGIAVDALWRKMYWVDSGTGKIQRANLDGTNIEDIVTGLSSPFGIGIIGRDLRIIEFVSGNSEAFEELEVSPEILVRLNLPVGGMLEEPLIIDVVDEGTGTATPGEDYVSFTRTTLTFPVGSENGTTIPVDIDILQDDLAEGDETVNLKLTVPEGEGMIGSTFSHSISIINDDFLIGQWKFDGAFWEGVADEVVDSSGLEYHGIAENNAQTTAAGKIDGAGEFDGVDDAIYLGVVETGSSLQFTSGGTITAWFYQREGGDRYQWIVDKSNSNGGANGYSLLADPIERSIHILVDRIHYRTDPDVFELNEWTHVAAVIGADDFAIYVNGKKQNGTFAVGTPQLPPDVETEMRLGRWNHAGGREFNGFLDDIRIIQNPLEPLEIEGIVVESSAGMVGHWKLDEAEWEGIADEVVDSSILEHHGMAENNARPTTAGKIDGAGEFDGVDDAINLGVVETGSSLQFTSGGTITAWFYQREGGDRYQRIVDKSNSNGGANGYSLLADPVERSLIILVDRSQYRTDPDVFELNEWTHVAAVIGADDFAIYVNGKKQNGAFVAGAAQLPPDVETEMRLGRWNHAGGREFNGFLDDIRMINRGLDPLKIEDIVVESSAGMVGHWKLDEAEWEGIADEVVDSSILEHHGMAENNARPTTAGKIDGAGEFDGVDDAINLGVVETGSSLQFTSGGTITAWFYQREGGDRYQRIVDKSNSNGGANGYSLLADPVERSLIILVDRSQYRTDPDVFELNEWTHVAAVIGADDFAIYVNGKKQNGAFVAGAAQLPPDVETEMRLGSWNHAGGREFNGLLDDIRMINRGLDPLEIEDIVVESSAGMVGHWKLDEAEWEGIADEVVDSSILEHHGMAENNARPTTAGKIDGAGEFDGVDDAINLGVVETGSSLQFTSGGTITAWFYQREGGDRYQRIVDKSNSNGGANGYSLLADPVERSLIILVDRSQYRTTPDVFELNEWTHVAAVIGVDDFAIYVNGKKQNGTFVAGAAQLPLDVETEMRLGSWNHAGGREFNGLLDDIRMINRGLDPLEIEDIVVESSAGMVGHWKLDEAEWEGIADEVVETYLSKTIYENAEDGSIDSWVVYGNGKVMNIEDTSGNRIISTESEVFEEPFRLGLEDKSDWNNTKEFTAYLAILMVEDVAVYFRVETSEGEKFLCYQSSHEPIDISDPVICFGLGFEPDGQWHTIYRDLETDLKSAQPNARLISIKDFYVFGTTKLDNIMLLDQSE